MDKTYAQHHVCILESHDCLVVRVLALSVADRAAKKMQFFFFSPRGSVQRETYYTTELDLDLRHFLATIATVNIPAETM